MKHLLNIESLSIEQIDKIISRTNDFENGLTCQNRSNAHILNMFFENSTRTKMSFEMAINKINAKRYDFCASNSSLNKGEDIFDTINNLTAIGMKIVILRHSQNDLIDELAKKEYFHDISFVNAGSGTQSHPTQALLDFYTMKQHFGDVKGKTIVLTGDIIHSRVAKSNIALLKKYGAKIRCLAPTYFMGDEIKGVEHFDKINEAFKGADIIMALRVQKERIKENIDIDSYVRNYRITRQNLPDNVFLMHPGPINKDIEIQSDVLGMDCAKTILRQAQNGVYVRMAVLDILLKQWGL